MRQSELSGIKIHLHYGTRLQEAKLINIMAKTIVKDDKFITITSDLMGSTRYHIPGLLQTCTSIDYIFLMNSMTLIWLLISLINHRFLQLMITCEPYIVTQEGWTSQGTRWNQTLF